MDYDGGLRSKLFRQNISTYNSMLAFTSIGGTVDNSVNNGNGPYVYHINGLNHHKINTLLPMERKQPKFTQIYIYDTDNEVRNRMRVMGSHDRESGLGESVVDGLINMLDQHNPLVKVFRMARDRFRERDMHTVKIRLIST